MHSKNYTCTLYPQAYNSLGNYEIMAHNGEKGHDVIVAKIPENKLCNRFGNIAVCKCYTETALLVCLFIICLK